MKFTAQDLIDFLQDLDPDTEIRIAEQPNWPFEYSIDEVVEVDGIVYIGEGSQIGYLPGEVSNELGWR